MTTNLENWREKLLTLPQSDMTTEEFIENLLALQNAEHQKLVLEEHALAKKMEQDRVVKILEGMKKEEIAATKDSVWGAYCLAHNHAIDEAITLITQ